MKNKRIRKQVTFTAEEYHLLEKKMKSSTCKTFTDYYRKVILQKPLLITYRNRSLDDVLEQAIQLKVELVRLVHAHQDSYGGYDPQQEFSEWSMRYEKDKKRIEMSVAEVKAILHHLAALWLQ